MGGMAHDASRVLRRSIAFFLIWSKDCPLRAPDNGASIGRTVRRPLPVAT
jgi:hypothetical protein